jgi:anti-sigma regulatory factor (Ser/Thr protein kinase)
LCNEIDRTAMVAHPSYLAGRTGWCWLMPAAEMAGLAGGNWRSSPDPALTGWASLPRTATRTFGAEAQSVRAARDFAVATLRRWGTAERSQDIAIVVSELLTNALRHALPGPGDIGPRGLVRLGLLQRGRWLLCAVADPGKAAPVPRSLGSLAEAGRGLQMICAFSDQWGYTPPSEAGKVVWAMFTARHAPPSLARYPGRPGRDRVLGIAR